MSSLGKLLLVEYASEAISNMILRNKSERGDNAKPLGLRECFYCFTIEEQKQQILSLTMCQYSVLHLQQKPPMIVDTKENETFHTVQDLEQVILVINIQVEIFHQSPQISFQYSHANIRTAFLCY